MEKHIEYGELNHISHKNMENIIIFLIMLKDESRNRCKTENIVITILVELYCNTQKTEK